MKFLSDRMRVGFKRKPVWLFALAALTGSICFWLQFGIYSDREFRYWNVFVKHRLSTRFCFFAPCGESDTLLSTLNPQQQQAEQMFREFVEIHGGHSRSMMIPFR